MFIQHTMPDPYPGRCHCTKFNSHPNVMQYERCLGYEDQPHVCTWEERKPVTKFNVSGRRVQMKPEPWVSPLAKDEHEGS